MAMQTDDRELPRETAGTGRFRSASAPNANGLIAWPRAGVGCRTGALRGPPAVASTCYRAPVPP
jgi:hypothetical protein